MIDIQALSPDSWKDYELLDSGDEQKLEKFGPYSFIRPEPKALWHKSLSDSKWRDVTAMYQRSASGGGNWHFKHKIKTSWPLHWRDLTFLVKPTGFKHLGIFPEQAILWDFIIQKIQKASRPINVLNLFAYTGGSTLASLSAGASVTHVDSSKEILTWARDNAALSNLTDKPVRWVPEDALTFVRRELKRGNTYDAIILDPPKFGRGSKNEIWKIEEDLPKLIDLCMGLLSQKPLFIILNAYSISYSSITLQNILSQSMKKFEGITSGGELVLKSTNSVALPTSIFAKWESRI